MKKKNRTLKTILLAALLVVSSMNTIIAQSKAKTSIEKNNTISNILYKTIEIDGQSIFYREGGQNNKQTILFLHGFPSSSRMWQPLLENLSTDYHVIAPDYIGFGHSSQPDATSFNYTFDNLTEYIDKFISRLSLEKIILVQQDYGGPIGMRIAEKHPEKIQAIIIQNAVSHNEGLSPLWESRKAFWANREKYYDTVKKVFLSFETTKQRHIGNSPTPEKINPDTYTDEYLFLSKQGIAEIQMNLFYDYQSNIKLYPQWQQWLKKNQPKMLIIWGKYDPSFAAEGAWKYKEDVPNAEVHILEAGHFALDEAENEIKLLIRNFLKKNQF